jgi:hypothetical protein
MGGTSSRRPADLLGGIAGDRRPRFAALASRIRVLTADGRLPVGARLPAERDLAAAVGLSRTTVRAAYADFARMVGPPPAEAPESGPPCRLARTARCGSRPGGRGDHRPRHAAPSAPPEVPAALAAALDDRLRVRGSAPVMPSTTGSACPSPTPPRCCSAPSTASPTPTPTPRRRGPHTNRPRPDRPHRVNLRSG